MNDRTEENSEINAIIQENGDNSVGNLQEAKIDQNIIEKIETKGLKLKSSTKQRLNTLQCKFDDAESMISALINQYEAFNIKGEEKYSDRKAEIEKFSYFLDSIKNCYIQSLDMSSYIENKYKETLTKEIKEKNEVIRSLQGDLYKTKESLKKKESLISEKDKELKETKESFSRINLSLTTMEKELNDKGEIVKNLQTHISSLNESVEEGRKYKKDVEVLTSSLKDLTEKNKNHELTAFELVSANKDIEKYKDEVKSLKNEINVMKEYSNDLNEKIQNIILRNSSEIVNIKDENSKYINELEKTHAQRINEYTTEVAKLKETIFELKLQAGIK